MSFTGYLTLTEINHTYGTVVLTQKAHCEYYLIYPLIYIMIKLNKHLQLII